MTACLSAPAQAAEGDTAGALRVSGSVRVRYETLDGQARAGLNATDEQLALRTTLLAEYRHGAFRLGGELYDSRAYLGKQGSAISSNDVNAFEPVQAYLAADIDPPFIPGAKASVQLGRFLLNLGSRRLIAADDYRNATNSYTGVRGDLTLRGGGTATLFYTLPQTRLPDDLPSVLDNVARLDRESFRQQLWGGVVAQPHALGRLMVEASYYRFQEKDAPGFPTRDRNLHSIGARLITAPQIGRFDYEVEGIYQFGHASPSTAAQAARLPVGAQFFHADMGYSFPGPMQIHLSVEYDRASGDRGRGKYTRFDTLFGMRRGDFGPAGIYAAIGRTNISSPGVRVEIAPNKKWDAFATYRVLWLASAVDSFSTTSVRDTSGASGSFAGHQVEGRVRYWFVPNRLRGEVNAAWLAKGRFLKNAPSAPETGDTHYLAMAVTVSF
ncbi:MAG: alginate export family protein [Chakrabartia sp.]